MDIELALYEARVIGALIEKEITTPDQYPLSLNALTNACDQKSNREPVLELDEATVQETLDALRSGPRSGPGNLNKPISGESATFDGPTGQESGAEDGKKNETDTLSGVQGQSGTGSDGRRQDAGRTGAAV